MDIENICCGTIKNLENRSFQTAFRSSEYNLINFDSDCMVIKKFIEETYKSNDEDIKDFSNLITIINDICYTVVENKIFSTKNLQQIANIRLLAKELIKKKFREYEYNDRQFWNYQEAEIHYSDFLVNIWKPSVKKFIELMGFYRN